MMHFQPTQTITTIDELFYILIEQNINGNSGKAECLVLRTDRRTDASHLHTVSCWFFASKHFLAYLN
ncbi:hypothetical protein K1T71_003709 [Dendrolimus kikuchii]|uniref:Uncharacterized protein n=1 Tax=Dendrolimus kikuchii TaxID=765133 RepID=A0ACC1D8Z8_9NEOP|nr:hypothetical protein K1T71_003709 [Dendrolimus kikuchii]